MCSNLTLRTADKVASIGAADWEALFPTYPERFESFRLLDAVGVPGFSLHSLVVYQNENPLLYLPLFCTRYLLADMVPSSAKPLFNVLQKILPSVGTLNVIGVGFVEGEWGHVGFRRGVSHETMRRAWEIATAGLEKFRASHGGSIIAFVDMTTEGARPIPSSVSSKYCMIPGQSCGVLPLPFATRDQYLDTLSKSTRKDLRRKMKALDELRIVPTRELGEHLDRVYDLYVATVARAEKTFGLMPKEYFERFCREVAGATYFLYFDEETLIGFNLLIDTGEVLVDKYFGMDPVLGREHNLYFVSWLENVAFAIRRQLSWYHAGPAAPELKRRLGARFQRSTLLFRHRNFLVQKLLAVISKFVRWEENDESEPPIIGSYWLQAPESTESPDRELTYGQLRAGG